MASKKQRTLDSADLSAVVTKNESDLSEAVTRRDELQAAFDDAYVELHAAGDEVAIRRHRKGVAEAAERVAELNESLNRCRQALTRAQEAEEHERRAAAWREVDRQGAAIEAAGAEIEATMDVLAQQIVAFVEQWRTLREALPERPYSEWGAMWNGDQIPRHFNIQMFGKSGGLLCQGKSPFSVHEVANGPNFKRRVRESLAIALSSRPKEFQPEPPSAA